MTLEGGKMKSSFLIGWAKNHPFVLWLIKSAICLAIGAIVFFTCQGLWSNLMFSILCAFLSSFFYLGYQMSFNAGAKGENFIFKLVRIVMVALLISAIVGFVIGQIAFSVVAIASTLYLLMLSGLKEAGEYLLEKESYLAELE